MEHIYYKYCKDLKRSQKINEPFHELHHMSVIIAYPQTSFQEFFLTNWQITFLHKALNGVGENFQHQVVINIGYYITEVCITNNIIFISIHINPDIFYDEMVLIFFMNTIAKPDVKRFRVKSLRSWKKSKYCCITVLNTLFLNKKC